jgi:hypothetical protein
VCKNYKKLWMWWETLVEEQKFQIENVGEGQMKAQRDTNSSWVASWRATQELAQKLEKIDYKLFNSTIAQFLVWFEVRTTMITIMYLFFFLRWGLVLVAKMVHVSITFTCF